jgi:TP901 family phage tail tape measure protein
MASNSILAKVAVLFSANSAEFGRAMKDNSSALASFENKLGKLNNVLAGFGVGLTAMAIGQVFKSAIGVMMDFEKEMSTVKAITGATGKEFQALKKNALDLGASTRYTSKQVAGLQIEYGRLGFSTKEILAATGATLDLATATGEDLGKAADVAGSTVRSFGLSANETRRVVDVMAESFNKSALGLENFSEAMKYVAPIAAQAGISVEETTAMLGTLADAGIRGSMAGTSLRKIISDLGGETGTLSEKLKKLADKGLTGAQAMDEVGRTAYASLLVLAKNTDKTKELTVALNEAAGAGKEAAKIMSDNLAGDLTMLSSAYDGLVLSASESTGVIREVTQDVTKFLSALANGNGAFTKFVDTYFRWATIVPRTLISGISGISRLLSDADEANFKLREQDKLTKLIGDHVEAAFKGGVTYLDVYLKSLEGVEHEYEIVKAILEKFNAELSKQNQALAPQVGIIAGIEERLKLLEEAKKKAFSVGEINTFNDKIKALREELGLLNAGSNQKLTAFGKNQEKFAKKKAADPTRAGDSTDKLGFKDLSAGIPDTTTLSILPDVTEQVTAYVENIGRAKTSLQEWGVQMGLTADQQQLQFERQIETAVNYGQAVGAAIATSINEQESGAKSLKRVTNSIVQQFLRQAQAAIIASATKTSGPPPVVIAMAVAGLAAISALFGRIAGGGAGGGGGSAGMAKSAVQNSERNRIDTSREMRVDFDAVFTFQQGALTAAVKSENTRNSRLNG